MTNLCHRLLELIGLEALLLLYLSACRQHGASLGSLPEPQPKQPPTSRLLSWGPTAAPRFWAAHINMAGLPTCYLRHAFLVLAATQVEQMRQHCEEPANLNPVVKAKPSRTNAHVSALQISEAYCKQRHSGSNPRHPPDRICQHDNQA